MNHTFQHFNYKNRFIKPVKPTDKNAKNYQRELKKYEKHKKDFEKELPGLKPTGRSHQFCYTTEALIKQIAQDARNFFDGKMGRINNVKVTHVAIVVQEPLKFIDFLSFRSGIK